MLRDVSRSDAEQAPRFRAAQTLIEYALILTLIVIIALLVALSVIGDTTSESLNDAANALQTQNVGEPAGTGNGGDGGAGPVTVPAQPGT